MSSRRRAAILGGLAVVLGSLAASEVAGREAAVRRMLGPVVPVVVADREIERGAAIGLRDLAIRHLPARYAPGATFGSPVQVVGARAAVAIPAGADLHPALLATGAEPAEQALAGARRGERIARIVAVGAADELPPGSLADVLITREDASGAARTRLALRAARVVSSERAPAPPEGEGAALPHVVLGLRVSLAEAVELTQAQAGARELRVLPLPPGPMPD